MREKQYLCSDFLISKKGGTYEKDWNGIGDACMRCDGAGR